MIELMDSLEGHNGIVIDDSAAPSKTVLYSSLKKPPLATAGFIPSITSGNLTLTPYENHKWVADNTFTCPVSGTCMIWINFGINGIINHVANVNYQIDNTPVVTWVKFVNTCSLVHISLKLVKGNKIIFPANATSIASSCSYCFELLA